MSSTCRSYALLVPSATLLLLRWPLSVKRNSNSTLTLGQTKSMHLDRTLPKDPLARRLRD